MTTGGTPETQDAERGNIHIAYQVTGEGPPDLVLVWNWFSHLEGLWDIPPYAHFLRRIEGHCERAPRRLRRARCCTFVAAMGRVLERIRDGRPTEERAAQ